MQMEMEEENADAMEEEEQFVKVLLSNCLFERLMDICLHSFLKWRISEYSENRIDFQVIDCQNTKNTKKIEEKKRQLQDSNLRGHSPTDFESVSLTTRTNCLTMLFVRVL